MAAYAREPVALKGPKERQRGAVRQSLARSPCQRTHGTSSTAKGAISRGESISKGFFPSLRAEGGAEVGVSIEPAFQEKLLSVVR